MDIFSHKALLKLPRNNGNSNNNNGYLHIGPGLTSLLDKYQECPSTSASDGIASKRVSNNSEQLEEGIVDQEAGRVRKSKQDSTFPKRSHQQQQQDCSTARQRWSAELSPCLAKLLKAAQGLLKTLRLVHGVQRLKEELPRSATSHTLQHRRDVCFSQAVNADYFFGRPEPLAARLIVEKIVPQKYGLYRPSLTHLTPSKPVCQS